MLEKDPVCSKELDIAKTSRHARYRIRDFYFCSDQCLAAFVANSQWYYENVA
ncbi:MAG: YHS domain-containing protein [Candidatus Lokiarchaeota archaeon]|nr:YHS domain-containing protein [Candidatus Lokiarchaeota archaeon]